MKRYLQIGLTLLLILIVATACHDESEEVIEPSTLELVKSGKKKPKMVYSSGEKGARVVIGDSGKEDRENNEKLEVTMEVENTDLHIHCEGFMESAYLFIQDQSYKVIFTQNVALIDEDHPLDVYIPEAEGYPYRLTLESDKFYVQINIWLE
jgi:hypothetical protein